VTKSEYNNQKEKKAIKNSIESHLDQQAQYNRQKFLIEKVSN